MNKFIHIGFPKTGTTWLQQVVFPQWMRDNEISFFTRMDGLEFPQKPFTKVLFSKEGIIGSYIPYKGHIPDPAHSIKNIVNLFGKNIKVIITDRDSGKLNNSLYKHLLMAGYNIKKPPITMLYTYRRYLFEALKDNNIPYIILKMDEPFNYIRLAKFMDINVPTAEQKDEWNVIRVNNSLPGWLNPVFRLLNKFKRTNTLRKIIIFIFRLFIP